MTFQRRSIPFWAHRWKHKWVNWHFRRGRCGIYMWSYHDYTDQRSCSDSSQIAHLGHTARVFSTCDDNSIGSIWDAWLLGLRPWAVCQYRADLLELILVNDLLTCSSVIGWWRTLSSWNWSAPSRRDRNLGDNLVIECYSTTCLDQYTRHGRFAHLHP